MKEMGLRIEAGVRVAALATSLLAWLRPGRYCPTTRRPSLPAPGSWHSAALARSTGNRSQARGALKAPIDWATSVTVRGRLGRSDDSVGLIGEGCARPVRQETASTVESGIVQERFYELPLAGVAAGARNQDEASLRHGLPFWGCVQPPISQLPVGGPASTVSACL